MVHKRYFNQQWHTIMQVKTNKNVYTMPTQSTQKPTTQIFPFKSSFTTNDVQLSPIS